MFWIPIGAIAFVIWFISYVSGSVKQAKYDMEYSQWKKATEEFKKLTRDRDMEQRMRWDFEDHKIDCNAVVREFMGGDPKWEAYAGGNAFGKEKAEMVLMVQQGKFPGCTNSFTLGSVNPKSRFTEKEWTDMNAQFLLKIEETLRRKLRRNVVLEVQYYEYETGHGHTVREPLRECIANKHTNYITWAATLTFMIIEKR